MSDERLRELERRARETGAPYDEAAWLVERVRLGRLSRQRLEVAALCGHEGARLVLGSGDVPPAASEWTQQLASVAGPRPTVVALVSLARKIIEHGSATEVGVEKLGRMSALTDVVTAIEFWLEHPTPRARKTIHRRLCRAHVDHWRAFQTVVEVATWVVLRTANGISTNDERQRLVLLRHAFEIAADGARHGAVPPQLLPAVCAEVVAWALADDPAPVLPT